MLQTDLTIIKITKYANKLEGFKKTKAITVANTKHLFVYVYSQVTTAQV